MNIKELIKRQRNFFESGKTRPWYFRHEALESFYEAVERASVRMGQALRDDLNRPEFESYATETGLVLSEIRRCGKHLRSWMRPRRAGFDLLTFPSSSRVYPEPFGVALVMAPWNYPFQLSFLPLAAAVAAGNCVLLKPSRRAPASLEVMAEIIAEAFDPDHVGIVTDLGENYGSLLRERFDFVMYTGSAKVGREVMRAAAEHLTPVCLELGGKSPVIVLADANLDLAAKRIAWGKVLNAGQTCVAPDYILAEQSVKAELEGKIEGWFRVFAGENPVENPDYGKIISERAFDRLLSLAGTAARNGTLAFSREKLKIAPMLLPAVQAEDAVMEEEIFGPLLPSLAFGSLEEAELFVRARPKPLACYIFTSDKRKAEGLVERLPFGGGCVNDVIMHVASHRLPFGGVGESGMGRYHGKAGFDLFSNLKGVARQSGKTDIPLRYPPGNKKFLRLLKKFLR